MKQSKASFEEYAGIVIGGLIYFFVYVLNINDLLIAFPVLFTYQAGYSQIGYWMKYGLLFVFVYVFTYFAARKVIDEKIRKKYLFLIKSYLIGFFLWLIIVIVAYSLNCEIDDTTNLVGGYATMLMIILFMRYKPKRSTNCELI
nr:hypothetical protein [uncultured Methanolobus sp.]